MRGCDGTMEQVVFFSDDGVSEKVEVIGQCGERFRN